MLCIAMRPWGNGHKEEGRDRRGALSKPSVYDMGRSSTRSTARELWVQGSAGTLVNLPAPTWTMVANETTTACALEGFALVALHIPDKKALEPHLGQPKHPRPGCKLEPTGGTSKQYQNTSVTRLSTANVRECGEVHNKNTTTNEFKAPSRIAPMSPGTLASRVGCAPHGCTTRRPPRNPALR